MFGRTVFNTGNLSPEVEWPSDEAEEEPVLAAIELGDLSRLLSKAVSETLSPFEGRRIGFALSGGVDSSMLLFLVKRAMPDLDVVAYHSDWDYPPKSELRYAEMAASFADVPLKVIDVSPARQLPHLDDALTKVRNISYSTPPVYMVFEEMANDDVEVAVNALGLDELFAGYTFHKSYYERKRFRFIPYSKTLSGYRICQSVNRRYGTEKAWFLAHVAPSHAKPFVVDSDVDLARLYEERIRARTTWNSMHNFLLEALTSNFGNMIARAAEANGLNILYPYMHRELMRKCLDYPPQVKVNKAPVRALMRQEFGFPEELANRGEKWDKVGWGGTGIPYYQDQSYMQAIEPDMAIAGDWFTKEGIKTLSELGTKPSVQGLKMALFLKILELV